MAASQQTQQGPKQQPTLTTQSNAPQQQTQITTHKTNSISSVNVSSQPTAVLVNVTQNSAITTASSIITRAIVSQPLSVHVSECVCI